MTATDDSQPDTIEVLRARLATIEKSLRDCRDWALELERRAEEACVRERHHDEMMYHVSHDLRGPIRVITGWAELLTEDISATLSEKHQRYLAKIGQAAASMDDDIQRFLMLNRLDRCELKVQRGLSLFRLINDSDSRSSPDSPQPFTFSYGEDIEFAGDENLMKSALRLLLDHIRKILGVDCSHVNVGGKRAGDLAEVSIEIGFGQRNGELRGALYSLPVFKRLISRQGGVFKEIIFGEMVTITFSLPYIEP